MFKTVRKAGSIFRKSLSLVLAFSMMISVCMVSAFSVSAAGSGSGNFYLVTTANSDWQGKTVTYKFANAGGSVLKGATASGTELYTLTAPSGATKLEVSRGAVTLGVVCNVGHNNEHVHTEVKCEIFSRSQRASRRNDTLDNRVI